MPPRLASEHPDHMPAAGAAFVAQTIDAIAANPEVWAKTAFILNYDENDGIFDHVAPPTPPHEHAARVRQRRTHRRRLPRALHHRLALDRRRLGLQPTLRPHLDPAIPRSPHRRPRTKHQRLAPQNLRRPDLRLPLRRRKSHRPQTPRRRRPARHRRTTSRIATTRSPPRNHTKWPPSKKKANATEPKREANRVGMGSLRSGTHLLTRFSAKQKRGKAFALPRSLRIEARQRLPTVRRRRGLRRRFSPGIRTVVGRTWSRCTTLDLVHTCSEQCCSHRYQGFGEPLLCPAARRPGLAGFDPLTLGICARAASIRIRTRHASVIRRPIDHMLLA